MLAQRKSKPKRPAALLQADVDPEVLVSRLTGAFVLLSCLAADQVRNGESAERLGDSFSKTSMSGSELDHPIAWFSEFVVPNYSVPTNVEDDLIHPNGRRSSRSLNVP